MRVWAAQLCTRISFATVIIGVGTKLQKMNLNLTSDDPGQPPLTSLRRYAGDRVGSFDIRGCPFDFLAAFVNSGTGVRVSEVCRRNMSFVENRRRETKKMWDEYNRIDPDYRAGDLVLNIEVEGGNHLIITFYRTESIALIVLNNSGGQK